LNFVPKKPMEAALAEALAGIALPAWVIDVPRGQVVRGNGRGDAVWGVPVMTLALESAIPALRSVRARLVAPPAMIGLATAAHPTATEILEFRTAAGTCAIPSTIRLLDDSVGRGMVLVIADGEPRNDAIASVEGGARPPSTTASRPFDGEAQHVAARPWDPVTSRVQVPGGGNGGMPLSDAETLREIARRIRQGSAGASNANDAPDDLGEATAESAAPSRPRAALGGGGDGFDWPEHLAHEIRTPLAAIVSLAEVITEERLGAWPNERYRGYIRDILDSARHGLDVVDGILRDVPDRQGTLPLVVDMDLNAEVEAICTSLQPLAEKSSARLDAALVSGLPRVIADRRNVRQMLLNLITNSIKHSGGPVRIKVTTGYELAGEIWVEVEDNGPGFTAVADKVGRNVGQGGGGPVGVGRTSIGQSRKTGLGLPLTKSLATANGARLDISSQPGGGVRARIVFGRDRNSPPRD
jgi:anti-sigma regulatory factor (Ser/Thr protein kinase)